METILVTTDFTFSSRNAVRYAAALARDMKSKLFIFHSFQMQMPSPDFPVVSRIASELEKKAEKILKKEAHVLEKRYEITVEAIAQPGFYPPEEILRMAKKLKPDLLVMGMKKKKRVTGMLAGSTVTEVLRNTKAPVMIIPEKAKFVRPEKVLLAFDYSTLAGPRVFSPLRELSTAFRSEVYVVNVLQNGENPARKNIHNARLEKALNGLKHVYYFPLNNNFQKGIDAFLDKHSPALMAMVPHKHNLLERLFGKSNTKTLAFHARIPLLALPDSHVRRPTYFI